MVILKNAGNGRCHQGLSQTNHVSDEHSVAFVQVMSRNLDCRNLEIKELLTEIAGDAELGQAGSGLLRKMVGHLQVDVVRRGSLLACPAILDDCNQFVGNVEAPTVIPSVFKPLGQFLAGVVVHYIHVQFTLIGKTGEGQIAAAQKADRRIDRIGAE